jgi:catechol 2,3-dioxygenase-like lactoylglutathione lyase family enzyme
MSLVQGISHVALVTADLDRFTSFYCDMFGAELVAIDHAPFGRVGIIRLGAGTAINAFEIDGSNQAAGLPAMFGRGHLDHFGIHVTDDDAFWQLCERLVAGGHSTGEVTTFGPVIGLTFTDPDGMSCEINLVLDPSLSGAHGPEPYERTAAPAC